MITSEIISTLDLPSIFESEGIHLRRSGNGFQFLCPFHADHKPSGSLYNKGDKWRFKCFGCQAGGDAIDFIQMQHGLGFKGALSYLGLESGSLTPEEKAKIKKNKQKRKIKQTFKKWELAALDELRDTIFMAYRISSRWKIPEDITRVMDPVADLQGQMDVLMHGPKKDRIGIYNRWKQRGGRF